MITNAEEIIAASDIVHIIGEFVTLSPQGKDYGGVCPFCGATGTKKGRKFTVAPKKGLWKCFSSSCDKKGKDAVSFVMEYKKVNYPEALKIVAEKSNVLVQEVKEERKLNTAKHGKPLPQQPKTKTALKSFRDEKLEKSGLALDQQRDTIFEDSDTEKEIDRYQAATINERWEIIPGDDIILHYVGLDGKRMMHYSEKRRKNIPLIRVRWQFPEQHPDKDGDAIKYQSPYDSGTHIWIPAAVRRRYQQKVTIKTLFIQEGETKADKATQCGMFSVGVMGIHNIAGKNKRLPAEFELIIKTCRVENVVFVVDADWLDLSNNPGKAVDIRPKTFKSAITNYMKHFYAFNFAGQQLNVFFAHIKKQEGKPQIKGTDDLLAAGGDMFTDPTKELAKDFENAMLAADGLGTWVNCYDITGKNEAHIRKLMKLDSAEQFAEEHRDELQKRGVFKIDGLERRFNKESGKLELAQPLMPEEMYWKKEFVVTKFGEKETLKFSYTGSINFLTGRGFSRYQTAAGYMLTFLENKVLREVEPQYIRDYVVNFTRNINEPEVLELLYRGGKQYLGPEKFADIPYYEPKFFTNDKTVQYLFFKTKFWKITAEGIEEKPITELDGCVWSNQIIDHEVSLLKEPLVKATEVDKKWFAAMKPEEQEQYPVGSISLEFNELAKMDEDAGGCHFLKFIVNASNFYHDKARKGKELTLEEKLENNKNVLNKLTGIGYLQHGYFDGSYAKAVIGQDATMTEVGDSDGRSGKSLIGDAIEKMVPTMAIPGKSDMDDRFLFEGIDEKTAVVFIDDVRVNYDFEALFSHITGRFRVNPKGGKAFTIRRQNTPKFYITTNHGVNENDGSTRDRIIKLAFSDYYNENYKPIDDFGYRFFDEWDAKQWNLFYNLMANCLQLYFQMGRVIPAPGERLELRRLRNSMGESFREWAEGYFINKDQDNPEYKNLNCEIPKEEVYKNFCDKFPAQVKYINITSFKKKLRFFCEYKGYLLNPGREYKKQNWGGDIKKGGVEFIIVTTKGYTPLPPGVKNLNK